METGILRQARGVAEKNDDDKLSKEEVTVSLSKVPTLMTKTERELSNYLDEWVLSRYGKWNELYRDINQYRHTGIYLLKRGNELLDFLFSVVSNLEEHFGHKEGTRLIPYCFSSERQVMDFLENFDRYVKQNIPLIEENFDNGQTNYIVQDLYCVATDIIEMVDRCRKLYNVETQMPPAYLQARNHLYEGRIDNFIDIMKSLISSVPYNVHKEKIDEGYFHTIFHVICSTLGFIIVSEKENVDGRIDVAIEFPHVIYIFEFKYSEEDKDESQTALKQIKDKHYDQSYHIRAVEIIGIGVSYGKMQRNINGHLKETLYSPPSYSIGKNADRQRNT